MLSKLKQKIFLIISCLFIILILYLFPKTEKQNITNNPKINNKETIYLIDKNNYVSRVSIETDKNNKEDKIKEIINYLTINSSKSNYIKEGFSPIIPKNTKLLSISIDKDLVKLNFSKDFYNIDPSNEEKLLSTIIYSITSIEGINKVSIYIEGNILTKMPNINGQLPSSLDRSFGINKKYNITNVKGLNKTTVYYLSKYNDYYYYVPITLINNEDKDKIEIIIEELSSKSVYQTNLISYLKYAQKTNYEIKDDYILINLNPEIFNTLNENIKETVIYSINLSIKDNYNINKVIYTINNNLKTYYI